MNKIILLLLIVTVSVAQDDELPEQAPEDWLQDVKEHLDGNVETDQKLLYPDKSQKFFHPEALIAWYQQTANAELAEIEADEAKFLKQKSENKYPIKTENKMNKWGKYKFSIPAGTAFHRDLLIRKK